MAACRFLQRGCSETMLRGARRLPFLLMPLIALGCGRSSRSSEAGEQPVGGAGSVSGAGGATAGGGNTAQGSSSVSLDGRPIYTRAQRLTVTQWEHAVTDILRLQAPPNLSEGFQLPLPGVTDFTNNESLLSVDVQAAQDFETGAEAAAALATGTPAALARVYAGTDAAGLVSALGRRAFRRPLTAQQQTRYEEVFALGQQLYGPDFANGAALVIRAMLQSPYFLYRTELGTVGEPLDGYEAASKLAFWLLGTTPSDALLDAAAAGELDSAEGLASVARQMLEQPAAVAVMRDFHDQAYGVSRFAERAKVGAPELTAAASSELVEASHRFFDRIFEAGEGLREVLTSERAFVGPALAPFYGMKPPVAIEERALDAPRAGFFSQLPFLLAFSVGEQSNPIARGVALNQDVLCARLDPPPPEIGPLAALSPGQTNRELVSQLTADCGTCHRVFINPLGFAFEGFDGLGRWRELDAGKPVDASGSFPFEDGEAEFRGAKELMTIIAETTQAHLCYAKKVSGYALQRDIVQGDRPLLESLSVVSREQSLKEMVVALAVHPAFRMRQGGAP